MTRTAKLIDEMRVVELMDCYGADPQCWPEEERASAIALIKHSLQLQQHQQEAQRLDEAMQVANARQFLTMRPDGDIVNSIINELPARPGNNTVEFSDHLSKKPPDITPKWWQYSAVAAAAVLVMAVVLITEMPRGNLQPTQRLVTAGVTPGVTSDDLDQWFWEQATGQSDGANQGLSQDDYNEDPTTFMAMVEMESTTSQN